MVSPNLFPESRWWHELWGLPLLALALGFWMCSPPKPPTPPPPICDLWEYKVQYSLPTPRPERKGDDAAKATSITPSAEELAALGKEGWELTGLVLEDETAYPQFDKVAVPNVRPQRLVLFFKKPACRK